MTGRPTIDAAALPAEARDAHTPAWWGNTLFMCIETSTVCLLLASYLYLWRNDPQTGWPPPRVDRYPAIYRPVPDLLFGTLNAVLLLASVPLAVWLDRLCRRQFDDLDRLHVSKPEEAPPDARPPDRKRAALLGLGGLVAVGCVSLVLRWFEFGGLHVRWNDNAYASVVWSLLVLHLIYLAIEVIEFAALLGWAAGFGFGQNLAGDVLLSDAYWYWTVAVGVLIYAVVYWFPRLA